MKRFYFLSILLFTFFQAYSNGGFNYQAVVRDANGNPLINQTVIMKVEIAAGSTAFYTESHSVKTNAFGLINVVIGEGDTNDDFSSISWGGKYDLVVSINGEVFDSQRMQSVPYAYYAENGLTPAQAQAIVDNSAKNSLTTAQANAIVTNSAKVGITEVQASAITANSAKVGITTEQAAAITANTAKVGITEGQAAAINLNNAKVGITTAQADAITANTAKTGLSSTQASAITANTAKLEDVSGDEVGYLKGVTSSIQGQIDAKTGAVTTGTDNILVGKSSYSALNSGTNKALNNTAFGVDAMAAIKSGDNNTAVGNDALTAVVAGSSNVGVGYNSLKKVTSGQYNVAVGNASGSNIVGGSSNTFIGNNANSGTDQAAAKNRTAIGAGANATSDNTVVLGNGSVTEVWMAEDKGAVVVAAGLKLGGTTVKPNATEINYLDGVTSSIQDQLDAKTGITTAQASAIEANTAKTGITTAQATAIDLLDGVSSNVQTQLDAKLESNTGTVSTLADLPWTGSYTLNNQNRPHDVNKDGSSDFERFDQKGNSQLNLDIDDESTRSYKIITYSGSSFDPSVIFSEQISNDSRPYEVKHDFSNQVGYVAYGAKGTTTTFAFWFDGDNDKIYYYNHTDGYGLKNNTALISNSNGKIISSDVTVQK